MALTESRDLPLGTPCPDFRLPTVDGKTLALDDCTEAKALVVMFICNHCPYVQAVEDRLIQLHYDYAPRGVQVVGICSNDPTDYPDDRPEKLLARWRAKSYGFPYLVDESLDVARRFAAGCTPDIFVFDPAVVREATGASRRASRCTRSAARSSGGRPASCPRAASGAPVAPRRLAPDA